LLPRSTFRVVVDSLPDRREDGSIWIECQSADASIMRTIMLAPGQEFDDDIESVLYVAGSLYIIDQTDIKDRPYLEYRIANAVFVER
jgi:hypothetical protein